MREEKLNVQQLEESNRVFREHVNNLEAMLAV